MARDVASRALCDEAFRARRERAAARFSSIHERWPATAETSVLEAAASEAPASGVAVDRHHLALPGAESGVCVTPILGIATDADDDGRPRFKTLMGVPRTDPDVDEYAGLDIVAPLDAANVRDSSRSDTARLQRPTPPPLPSRFFPLPEAARPPSSGIDLQASAATATAPRVPGTLSTASRTMPAQRSALLSRSVPLTTAQSSLDVALELAALRRSQKRRGWLVGIGSFTATLLVFALAAPHERTLAVRWLRQEYQSRIQPSTDTVADTARALRPGSVLEPMDKRPAQSPAQPVATLDAISELRRTEARPTTSNFNPSLVSAASATEVASEPRSEPASEVLPRAAGAFALPSEPDRSAHDGSARDESTVTAQSKPRLAAPRKRSTRSATVKTPAAGPMKERATRQNSSRRDVNGGIIRETPF